MKKTIALVLAMAMVISLGTMFSAVFASEADTISVGTADELVSAIAAINNGEKANTTNITLTADIDCSAITSWKPLVSYAGTFDGANHTISGLSNAVVVENNDANSVDAGKGNNYYRWSGVEAFPEPPVENLYGNCGFGILAVKLTGTVKNLTVANGSMSLKATFNKNNLMDLAYLVGYADGATFDNVTATGISVSTIGVGINENQGYMGYTAVIAGRAVGNTTFKNVTVDNTCTVNTSETPRMNAAEILGAYVGNGSVTFDACTAEASVTVCTSNSYICMWANGVRCDGVPGDTVKFVSEEADLIYGSLLAVKTSGNYEFYYQTRTNADDSSAYDYRIICVAKTDWVTALSEVKVSMSFTDGTDTVTKIDSANVAYNEIVATGDGYTDVYSAAEGTAIFGWVVTGVPEAFTKTTPTATVVE